MYRAWCTDPEVTRYLRFAPHKNVEETCGIVAGWIANYQKPDWYIWAVTLKDTGELIGSIGVFPANGEDALPGYWEPGYTFARPHWNMGYASEALCAVVPAFIRDSGITQLYCCHAKANPASGRVMEKAGFQYHRDGVYHKLDGTPLPAKYYLYEEMRKRNP